MRFRVVVRVLAWRDRTIAVYMFLPGWLLCVRRVWGVSTGSARVVEGGRRVDGFLGSCVYLLELFLCVYDVVLIMGPINLPHSGEALQDGPVSRFFSMMAIHSLSLISPYTTRTCIFVFFGRSGLATRRGICFFIAIELHSQRFHAGTQEDRQGQAIIRSYTFRLEPTELLPLTKFL